MENIWNDVAMFKPKVILASVPKKTDWNEREWWLVLEALTDLMFFQANHDGLFIFDVTGWPKAEELLFVQNTLRDSKAEVVEAHGCCHGLAKSLPRWHLHGTWRLWTNCPEVKKSVEKSCFRDHNELQKIKKPNENRPKINKSMTSRCLQGLRTSLAITAEVNYILEVMKDFQVDDIFATEDDQEIKGDEVKDSTLR